MSKKIDMVWVISWVTNKGDRLERIVHIDDVEAGKVINVGQTDIVVAPDYIQAAEVDERYGV